MASLLASIGKQYLGVSQFVRLTVSDVAAVNVKAYPVYETTSL